MGAAQGSDAGIMDTGADYSASFQELTQYGPVVPCLRKQHYTG